MDGMLGGPILQTASTKTTMEDSVEHEYDDVLAGGSIEDPRRFVLSPARIGAAHAEAGAPGRHWDGTV